LALFDWLGFRYTFNAFNKYRTHQEGTTAPDHKNEGTTPDYTGTMYLEPGTALPGSISFSRYNPGTSYGSAAHLDALNRYTKDMFFC
jgi:hypothetical protein